MVGVDYQQRPYIAKHLVSHGFVVAGVNHQDTSEGWRALVDRPLDILFLLNQLANLEDDPLAGMIDTDNVGVMGYSFGGYTTIDIGGFVSIRLILPIGVPCTRVSQQPTIVD
jgi:predicted dienelactone hydrolase